MSRSIAAGLLALALAASFVVPTAPCLTGGSAGGATAIVYAFASLVCHQRPERSFATCGREWPVCGRCSGLYLGAGAGAAIAAIGVRRRGNSRLWRRLILWTSAPTVLSWALEVAGAADPGTTLRFAFAVPLGLVVALWLAQVARGHLR